MGKNGQMFIGILIGVILLLIIYVIVMGKKPTMDKKNNLFQPKDNGNGTTPDPVVIPPPVTADKQTFSIGDQIYAGADLTNAYKSCSVTQSNIDVTYKNGDLIGTFLRKENNCIVIAIKTSLGWGLGWIWEGSRDVYLPVTSLIYKQ